MTFARHLRAMPGRMAFVMLALIVAVPVAAHGQTIPSAQVLNRAVQEAHERFRDVKDGANADYIPELAKVPPELFGVAIVGFSPRVNEAGNSVRAMKAIEYISDQLGVNVFGSGR